MKERPNYLSQILVIFSLIFIIALVAQGRLLAQGLEPALYLPLILKSETAPVATEWTQHAHDAQHTNYTSQSVPTPWRWRWVWNGPDASGGIGKVTTNGSLPRTVQPITGGGRVYIAAGVDGVFALSEASGAQVWQRSNIGSINSTVAYDPDTQTVFAVSANGKLYKLRASDGFILGQ
ncbi:MAG: PQQ-binding-like beta-propeller repeat protein, partial [Anaerolineales bacterium]|nr:PQQ-binding-like beta-propeller repeat protein [Anaerolineales bacterium]MDW8446519.1 PQQ-binding-like beta-propeller repeat protein [Anaerolineales bacterium]